METPYIYYIPIYPDDDNCETLMHLFIGQPGLDTEILSLLEILDNREHEGEAVDYVHELEDKCHLKRVSVRFLPRNRDRAVPIMTWAIKFLLWKNFMVSTAGADHNNKAQRVWQCKARKYSLGFL